MRAIVPCRGLAGRGWAAASLRRRTELASVQPGGFGEGNDGLCEVLPQERTGMDSFFLSFFFPCILAQSPFTEPEWAWPVLTRLQTPAAGSGAVLAREGSCWKTPCTAKRH